MSTPYFFLRHPVFYCMIYAQLTIHSTPGLYIIIANVSPCILPSGTAIWCGIVGTLLMQQHSPYAMLRGKIVLQKI